MSPVIEESVRSLASEAIRNEGMDLVAVEFRREPSGWVLRLFIDKAGGVGLSDCQRVSEVVGTLLEVEDSIPHTYTLEVSSPGLTRPLQRDEDWNRALGKLVKVITRQVVAGRQDITGRLVEVTPATLVLDVEGTTLDVPRDLVARARMEVEWPRASGADSGQGRRRRTSGK
jgi:ribosome maturation factor RimP